MTDERDRPADEIEVTLEMIRAGAAVIASFDRRVADDADLAVWVYQAMVGVDRRTRNPSGAS